MKFKRILPLAQSIQALLGAVLLLDALKVYHHPTIHRATVALQFQLKYDLTPFALPLVAVTAIHLAKQRQSKILGSIIIASLMLYQAFGLKASVATIALALTALITIVERNAVEVAFYTLASLTAFECIALAHWAITLPLMGSSLLEEPAFLELSLFYIVAPLSPLLMLSILYAWLAKPIVKQHLTPILRYITVKITRKRNEAKSLHLNPKIAFALSIILSVIVAAYPYIPSINPKEVPVGVDIRYYAGWTRMLERDLNNIFTIAGGSRPTILLLLYALRQITGLEPIEVVKWTPILLNPLLTIITYYMISRATEDDEWAALSALITAIGLKATVNMYSYFLTNMLALIFQYASITLLAVAIEKREKVALAAAIALSSAAIFTHPWTFTQYYAAIALSLLIQLLRRAYASSWDEWKVKALLAFLAATGIVDAVKEKFIGAGSYKATQATVISQPMYANIMEFWNNNIFAFRLLYGGYLSNAVLLAIAALGAYTLSRRGELHKIIMNLLIVTSITYPFVNGTLQSRLIFNLPIEVLAAQGLLFIVRKITIPKKLRKIAVAFTITSTLTYALRSLANLI